MDMTNFDPNKAFEEMCADQSWRYRAQQVQKPLYGASNYSFESIGFAIAKASNPRLTLADFNRDMQQAGNSGGLFSFIGIVGLIFAAGWLIPAVVKLLGL